MSGEIDFPNFIDGCEEEQNFDEIFNAIPINRILDPMRRIYE